MADCTRFAPKIGARRGELPPEEARALEAHLATCDTCRAFAADVAVVDGLVRDGLIAKANARDFSPFVDQVMARVEAQGAHARARAGQPVSARASGAAPASPSGPLAWLARHRRAIVGALTPVLAAAAVVLYVRLQGDRAGDDIAMLELASEGNVTMVLQTADGPVVLIAAEEHS